MKSLLKAFERHVDGRKAATKGRRNARDDTRIELAQSTQATSIPQHERTGGSTPGDGRMA
jgi:hypothetical protein